MFGRPTRLALLGFVGGWTVVAITLLLEVLVRGVGLGELHRDSVSIWVVYSLPFTVALAGLMLASRPKGGQGTTPYVTPSPSVSVSSMPPPPVPKSIKAVTYVPTLVEEAPTGTVSEARYKALQELVKVLKEQTERQASESRAKSAYLANMTHELRTPLSSIVGYAELLQEEAEEGGLELADDLRKVAASGRQLVDLINNILDLSKIEVGQLAVVLEDVDMAQIVDEVRVIVAPLLHGGTNMFSARVAPGARLVRGDHMRLRQILVHLLSNAFKFTRNGQIQLLVERATPKRDAWIAIRVKDTGVGMTPGEIERAFDEYAQVAERVTGQGGLGLAISRKLAELMGGRIEVESEKGVGSTFMVILPPAKIGEETIPPRSAVALNERLTGTRVLVVDPEASGISISRYLERAGLEVRLVTDCQSARLAEEAENPQIVIVDVGLEDAWGLVEDLVVEGIKVVATSVRDEDVERGLQTGVTAFLLRPLERKLVLATLERCIELSLRVTA
jgi:signal transduction histidine kinase